MVINEIKCLVNELELFKRESKIEEVTDITMKLGYLRNKIDGLRQDLLLLFDKVQEEKDREMRLDEKLDIVIGEKHKILKKVSEIEKKSGTPAQVTYRVASQPTHSKMNRDIYIGKLRPRKMPKLE